MKRKIIASLMALTMLASLSACGVSVSNDASSDKAETEVSTEEKAPVVTDSNEEVTLTIIDWADSFAAPREEFHAEFEEKYPNIKIDYTCMTFDQFSQSVITAIKSGEAPDLFPVPSGMSLSAAVSEGWFQPMQEYLTDDFLATFADGAINEGTTHIGDDLYALPSSSNLINTMIYYNQDILDAAGVTEIPTTWSEFTAACAQITEAGNGEYYGLIDSGAQTNRLELALRAFAATAGNKNGDINQILMTDGYNTLNSEEMKMAFEFYETLVTDGSMHPDSINLGAAEARALFGNGQAGFIVQGDWCVATWRAENPELNFGVMGVPSPDAGQAGLPSYVPALPWVGVSATCEHPDVAALYLEEFYSYDTQVKLVEAGGLVSIIDGVNEAAITDEVTLEYLRLHNEAAALAPDPKAANPATADVYANVVAVSPNLGDIVQGVIAQSINWDSELDILAESTQASWEAAIDSVEGVEASDFEFANWDTMKNYTSEYYSER